MEYEVRETEFAHSFVLPTPSDAYDAADEAEKARVRKLVKADDIYNPELANSIRHYKEEGENNMCSSVKAYGDIRAAEAEARGRAEGRAETAKEYQSALAERDAENARLRAELEKYKSAEKRN